MERNWEVLDVQRHSLVFKKRLEELDLSTTMIEHEVKVCLNTLIARSADFRTVNNTRRLVPAIMMPFHIGACSGLKEQYLNINE